MSSSVFSLVAILEYHGYIFQLPCLPERRSFNASPWCMVFWLEGGCSDLSRPGEAFWFFNAWTFGEKTGEFFCISDKKKQTFLKFLFLVEPSLNQHNLDQRLAKIQNGAVVSEGGWRFIRPKGFCFGMTRCQEFINISGLVQESPKVVDDWDVVSWAYDNIRKQTILFMTYEFKKAFPLENGKFPSHHFWEGVKRGLFIPISLANEAIVTSGFVEL